MGSENDRGFIEWSPRGDSLELVEQISTVVQFYRRGGYPAPTVRDIYYDLVGKYGYQKSESFHSRVYRFVRKMRRSGMIRFEDVDDDSSTEIGGGGYDSPADFWRGVQLSAFYYARDLTQNQPDRVIVLTEGAGKVRQFSEVASDYDVPVLSGGGWESITYKYRLARDAVSEYRETGRQTIALHCGDFDPDGVRIYESGVEDVLAFVEGMGEEPGLVIYFERVMLLPEQVPERGKRPFDRSKLKKNDHRGRAWPYDYKCELEALPIPERLEILRAKLEEYLDQDQVTADRQLGERERAEIQARVGEMLAE
jgi:hypothetical protein